MHGVDLQALRAESAASIEQVTQLRKDTINSLKAEHATILEEQTTDLSKQISKLTLELKATQDDLAKSKAALTTSAQELDSLKSQLEVARATAEVLVSSAPPDRTKEVDSLKKELADVKSDLTALQEVLAAANESIADITHRNGRDLEEAAEARAAGVAKLKSTHESEVAQLVKVKSDLASKLSDAQSEIATLRATIGAEPAIPIATRALGHGRTGSGTVTKEEIQKMHEAHNLKMNDLQVEHEKKLKELGEELEATNGKTKELEAEVSRKAMEISYLEQEQEEMNDTITRYVKSFGFKGFLGGALVLALIYF
jgi:chromosome segregation ATPase